MSNMRQEGRGCMTWSFLKTVRARQEWWDYGDRLTHMGLFDFLVPDNTGRITGTIPAADLERVHRWPHITYLLTVRNDGILSRFKAIVDNTGGAQDLFISELHRILDMYPFAAGVDIDLEVGPNDNPDGVVALAKRIYESVKGRPAQRYVHWDLPPMTGDGIPWWERWCDYRRMEPYFDSCAIMSYAFSWAGSAPGPISPMWWMEYIYDYAVTRIPREKIFLGIPGFGFNWRIDRKPAPGSYRGSSGTFLGFLGWQQGEFTFHAEQARIPFAGCHDHGSMSPHLMLHIYDCLEGQDACDLHPPAQRVSGEVGYARRNYLVTYEKTPVYGFQSILADRDGLSFDTISGDMDAGVGWVSPSGTSGRALYRFEVQTAGEYVLAVRMNARWWSSQVLRFRLNGKVLQAGPFPDWYPLHRRVHWVSLGRHSLPAGLNSLEVRGDGSQFGTQFWGFRVCKSFSLKMDGGGGTYTLMPRKFKEIGGSWVLPADFILTPELLRHAPDHAWVWYDDFRDNTIAFYNLRGGVWSVDTTRWLLVQASQAGGDAQAHLSHYGFGDLNIRARMRMTAGSGTMGIVFKAQGVNDLYLFLLRLSTQTAELWRRSGGTWFKAAADVHKGVSLNTWYSLRVRSRGSELNCWVDEGRLFNLTVNLPAEGGFGIRTSGAAIECSLLDAGSPYTYVPQEAVEVSVKLDQYNTGVSYNSGARANVLPATFGRIQRSGVTWLEPWGYFEYLGTGEEADTRTEEIPLDFDFVHTAMFPAFEGDRPVRINLSDRGVWVTNLYLGDARGFSLAHYSDAEHFDMLANLAKHRWGLNGVAWWALGLQDPRVFQYREGAG